MKEELRKKLEDIEGKLLANDDVRRELKREKRMLVKEAWEQDFGDEEPCSCDYYQVRSGECKHGETYGYHGDEACVHPKCSRYTGPPSGYKPEL